MTSLTSSTRVLALLGDPVDHSLSPVIQNAAFREAGVDGVYVALRCDASDLVEFHARSRTGRSGWEHHASAQGESGLLSGPEIRGREANRGVQHVLGRERPGLRRQHRRRGLSAGAEAFSRKAPRGIPRVGPRCGRCCAGDAGSASGRRGRGRAPSESFHRAGSGSGRRIGGDASEWPKLHKPWTTGSSTWS